MKKGLPKRPLPWVLAAIIVSIFLIGRFSGVIIDWLWFDELGYGNIFWRMLWLKLGLGITGGLGAFAFLGLNLHLAFRRILAGKENTESGRKVIEIFSGEKYRVIPSLWQWGAWLLAAFIAVPFGLYFSERWETALRFFWSQPVGRSDPIYGRDLGFYLFEFPFLQALQNNLTALAFLAFAGVLALSVVTSLARRSSQGIPLPDRSSNRHLTVTFLLFLAGFAWGYILDRYDLLYSTSGVVNGAGYTDLQVVRIALWVMVGASVVFGLITLFGYWRDRMKLALWGAVSYIALLVAALLIVPLVVQKFFVEPNELELEAPFLKHDIAFTRQAYGIDQLEERSYRDLSDLSAEDVGNNEQTLRNIRLWDWRPLLQTFRQLQEIRSYYQFYEVDVDRYHLDGEYRQVMLSPRELAEELPERADTWVNRTLQFTHGYGLAMSLASKEGEEGTPTFLIQDLPPRTTRGLELEKPAIFYGEKMPGYRIVNTKVQELDYPRGDENVYTSYAGKGGVALDSMWKKLLFAWELGDVNIILSDYLTDASRLQMRRRIQERVSALAPFLYFDSDPYLVLGGDKLYWIQDAYTISNRYPYAEPYQGRFNYIRNAVKVVVDVYDGAVKFYVMDPDEPILQVYRQAFSGVFSPLDDMPAGLRGHLRYPEDLFRIQVDKYNRYHMTIPQVFYNNEDVWTLPQEKYAGNAIPMEPYYILMRLPDEDRLEFLLMLPLTPQNRDNMIAWLAARCDEPDYGKLLVYKLPKDELVLGPIQVEAMIDQDPVISRQLSLWDQRGSRVIRGNLLVIPLEHSFIYVEPVYLISEGNNIPQLRRVVVAYNDRVVMEPTLEQAVAALFGQAEDRTPTAGTVTGAASPQAAGAILPKTLEEARTVFERAQSALEKRDWEEFGRAMGELQNVLQEEEKASP